MKPIKDVFAALLLCAGLCLTANAEMIVGGPYDGTDVGDVDTYIDEIAGMSSGDQTEVDWVNSVLGTSFTSDSLSRAEDVDWYWTDTSDVIAFALQTGPGYYLIKNAGLHVLFENVSSFDWGVINLNDILGNINLGDDFMISHVSEFGGGTKVPEPGTLALFGLGLLGCSVVSRRRSRSS